VHGGFILKANVKGVVLTGGKEFNVVQWLAVGLFKAVEVATGIAADGGLTAPGDNRFRKSGNAPLSLFVGFARGLRAVGRAFTLIGSHIASLSGDFGQGCVPC
jgi:hypothetical protein